MKIMLESAEAAESLSDHLRRCRCIVKRLGSRTLEAFPTPASLDADLAQAELEAYVRVWRELNPTLDLETWEDAASEPAAR